MPDGDAKNGMERGIDQLPFLVARSQTWSLCRGRFACSTKNPKKNPNPRTSPPKKTKLGM